MNLLVSVIVPAYNQGRFITESIESVLEQNYPQERMEIIVVDDGSTDGTREVVDKFKVQGIRYIYQPNSGKATAVKAGIEAAQGKYIFNLDADDIFLPNKIRKVVKILESDSEITYVSHPVIYWDEEKNMKRQEKFPRLMQDKVYGKELLRYFYKINRFIGCGSSFTGRADILKKILINRNEIGYSIDLYLVLFCANAGYAYFCDEPLSLYRMHSITYSSKQRIKRAEIDMLANEAIMAEVQQEDFDERIKTSQALKTMVAQLKLKEICREKKMSDVIKVWRFVLTNCSLLEGNLFSVIKNYRLLQRSVRF